MGAATYISQFENYHSVTQKNAADLKIEEMFLALMLPSGIFVHFFAPFFLSGDHFGTF